LELDMAQEPGKSAEASRSRILVIDDYEPFRASVKDLLEANGYDVAVAVDGEDGMRQFELQPFDLVLCDVFMPKKEGMETIKRPSSTLDGHPHHFGDRAQ
jgi:two-component system sensor histidine kinase and response regulator WspE